MYSLSKPQYLLFLLHFRAGRKLKTGKSRVLYGLDGNYSAVAVANLGKQDVGYDEVEQLDQGKENIRAAVASE